MTVISQKKLEALKAQMKRLGLFERDIEENFIRGSGPGGQKINKTASTVRLKHLPTGIEVKCQQTRSQGANRFFARRLLGEKYAAQFLRIKTEKRKKIEKIQRQKRKRSKRAKEKILKDKKRQSEKKFLRRRPKIDFS